MSLRNRARSLQAKTGLTYQQALVKLRALAERPAALSRQTGWSLDVCDRFLVDGHAPIEVVEPMRRSRPTRDELIAQRCEVFRAAVGARSVLVVTLAGRTVAHAGAGDMQVAMRALFGFTTQAGRVYPPAAKAYEQLELQELLELGDGLALFVARFDQGLLVVAFHHDETSYGLIRLRTRRFIDELEALLAPRRSPGLLPPRGGGGTGGLPAEVRVVEEPPEPRHRPAPPVRKKKR